jgi:predicted enzyme related to lactoylglutathione lyase
VKLQLMNAVVLAEDYARLRDWYLETLELELEEEWTEHYHYAELVKDGRLVVGIADAKEMGVEPGERQRQAVVAQFNVEDVKAFLRRVEDAGGTVPFGPSLDETGGFWFGGFADLEGNPAWVVQMPEMMRG